jgi:lipopolysaccharide/colanic/teichoic acid biosynthesis glycosyltransferase
MTTAAVSPWLRVRVQVDRLAAALLLVPVAPVIAVLALWVRVADGAPALISVSRMGQGGREFPMWKLRTMRPALPDGRAGGAELTRRDDQRITPVGRRLRHWRLDELPQLWNVVRGEMALLGPRPEAPAYVNLDDHRWTQILSVPPGIAGATQVLVNRWEAEVLTDDGTTDTYGTVVLPVKVELDGWYVRRATPGLDVLILRSLASSLVGRGSPELRRRAQAHADLGALPDG